MTEPARRDLDVEALLRASEERIFAAIRTRDVAGLEAELAEDFVHSPVGSPDQDREAFLAALRDMPYRIHELHGEEIRVRVLGDVALLSGVQHARVELPEGGVVTAATAFVDVFVTHDEGWRLLHAVSVELPAAPAG